MNPLQQIRPLALGLGLAGVVCLQSSALAVDLSHPGLACDNDLRICYDSQGASVTQTRRVYGERAERDLLRQMSGRPPALEFQFRSGELCSIRLRTCWDDGNQRRNVSNRITRQLFGNSGGNNGGNSGGQAAGEGSCQLLQRGRSLFSGGCRLSHRQNFGAGAYLVEMRDGRRYSFYNQGNGRLLMRDATGTWPVVYSNRGNGVIFRWADLQLTASDGHSNGHGSGSRPGYGNGYGGGYNNGYGNGRSGSEQTPATNTLEGLLNSLFN